MNTDTIPPNDMKLERNILSAMMQDKYGARIACEDLIKDDFYNARHAATFELFAEIFARDGDVDPIVVADEIRKRKLEPLVGSVIEATAFIEDKIPHHLSIEKHTRILKEYSYKRKILSKCHEASQLAANGGSEDEIQTVLARYVEQAKSQVPTLNKLDSQLEDTIAGRRYAVPLPWVRLSRLTQALLPGTITVLCGSPGATKSFMLLQAVMFWCAEGVPVACLELEDGVTYHLRRMLAQLADESRLTNDEWCKTNPEQAREALGVHGNQLQAYSSTLHELTREKKPTIETALHWIGIQAANGARVMAIDPYTLLDFGREVWTIDRKFLTAAKAIVEDWRASLVLIVHPRKHAPNDDSVTLDDVALSASLSRLSQTVLWLSAHKPKAETLMVSTGRESLEFNRTLHILKARNGTGEKVKLAFQFRRESLTLEEIGQVVD